MTFEERVEEIARHMRRYLQVWETMQDLGLDDDETSVGASELGAEEADLEYLLSTEPDEY